MKKHRQSKKALKGFLQRCFAVINGKAIKSKRQYLSSILPEAKIDERVKEVRSGDDENSDIAN